LIRDRHSHAHFDGVDEYFERLNRCRRKSESSCAGYFRAKFLYNKAVRGRRQQP